MGGAAGETPQQETVDRAEGQFSALGARPRSGHMIEDPGNLRRRKIGVEHQPGSRADIGLGPRRLELRTKVACAAILPDDRAMDGLSRRSIPNDHRFSLVGDADACEAAKLQAAVCDGFPNSRKSITPNVFGIVLDPT